jgi:hypothetical protein
MTNHKTISEPKIFRVYAKIVVEAAFDVYAESAEEASELLACLDVAPVYTSDFSGNDSILKIIGAVDIEDVSGTTFEENMVLLARSRKFAAQEKSFQRLALADDKMAGIDCSGPF